MQGFFQIHNNIPLQIYSTVCSNSQNLKYESQGNPILPERIHFDCSVHHVCNIFVVDSQNHAVRGTHTKQGS